MRATGARYATRDDFWEYIYIQKDFNFLSLNFSFVFDNGFLQFEVTEHQYFLSTEHMSSFLHD